MHFTSLFFFSFPFIHFYNCTALFRITTALSFTSPYRTPPSTECTHISALISLSAATHTHTHTHTHITVHFTQEENMPSPLSPLLSPFVWLTTSIDSHRQEEDGGRVFTGFGLCMRKQFLIEVNSVCVCVCVYARTWDCVCVCIYLYAWDCVWWFLWVCVFVEETAAEPEGQLWFSWHLYDLGVTGPSLHQTPTTNTHTHTHTHTQTHTPAVPSTSPLIPPSLFYSFAKGHIQPRYLPSFHLFFFLHLFIHLLLPFDLF